jgi:hypothetical protein
VKGEGINRDSVPVFQEARKIPRRRKMPRKGRQTSRNRGEIEDFRDDRWERTRRKRLEVEDGCGETVSTGKAGGAKVKGGEKKRAGGVRRATWKEDSSNKALFATVWPRLLPNEGIPAAEAGPRPWGPGG